MVDWPSHSATLTERNCVEYRLAHWNSACRGVVVGVVVCEVVVVGLVVAEVVPLLVCEVVGVVVVVGLVVWDVV